MMEVLELKRKQRGRPLGSKNKKKSLTENSSVTEKQDSVDYVASCCLCKTGFIKSTALTAHVKHCLASNLSGDPLKCKLCNYTLSRDPAECVTHSLEQHQNFVLIPRVNQNLFNS
ncbi:hypothetical protein RF11_06367 [Thelohanellus kitauei]|nr:hypothetical protein RF11_06367 [Thelohanellus kitauei]